MTGEMLLHAIDSYIRLIELRERLYWKRKEDCRIYSDKTIWDHYTVIQEQLDKLAAFLWGLILENAVWPEEEKEKPEEG